MKKLILAAFALTTAASVFAQGTVGVSFRYNSGVNVQTVHIWGPSTTAPTLSLIGLGSNDAATTGTTPYSTSGMNLIGANGSGGKYGYATTFFQLIGVDTLTSALAPESSLLPVGQTATFRSGTSLGSVATVTDTLSGSSPITAGGNWASFEIVVWDNSSGAYSSWAQASVAWLAGNIAAGKSTEFTVSAIGGGPAFNLPPNLNDVTPLTSFNLYFQSVPEPSSFALAGLGAAALLIFRRRK